MRTSIEIYTKFIERSTGEKLFAVHHKNKFVLKLIEQAQQEAYEEGRRDGYAACKSDYATQITYNK